jgi:UrcA family protein
MLRTVAIAALLTIAGTAARAHSSTQVAFGDLNLSRPEDARILVGRLQTAARMVCLKANNSSGLIGKPEMQQCVDAAITTAIARIEEQTTQHLLTTVRTNLVSARQRMSSASDFQH